jgi:hypothetical protein
MIRVGLFRRIILSCILLTVFVLESFAETGSPLVARGTLLASYPFHIVKGYLFVEIPTLDTNEFAQTEKIVRTYLIDIGASNEGSWLLDSTSTAVITEYKHVSIAASDSASFPLSLIPSNTRENFRRLDSAFSGTIGYGWLKQFVSVFDFTEKRWYIYRADNNPKYSARVDTAATHIPYLDDAFITYCHCPFPTIWLEVEAPPLSPGRVQLSLADNQSYIYKTALDNKTAKIVVENERADSLSGKSEFAGIELANFITAGRNIAQRNPRRAVTALPARFKDLNITVIGTLAVDVLRKYPALIIDPSRSKIVLVR